MPPLLEKRKPEALVAASSFRCTADDTPDDRKLSRERQQALAAAGQYPCISDFPILDWKSFKWLRSRGGPANGIVRPEPPRIVFGTASGIWFNLDSDGDRWLAFSQDDDRICWNPNTGQLALTTGNAWALGGHLVRCATFLEPLEIFADPLDWLKAERLGIVIVDWRRCYEALRDVGEVAVDQSILEKYKKAMQPPQPNVLVVLGGAA